MREHGELTVEDVVASPQQQQTVSSANDHGETVTVPGCALPGTPSRRKGTFALLAAVACTVFGAKLITISALGSSMPLIDQWNGEAERLYAPYLRGTLSFADLFAPHNEHRLLVTRVLTLVHLELAGEWNTRLEMILCAIVSTALITWLVALLMPLVAPRRQLLLACFVAFLFAFPIAYENTLLGFNLGFYFTLFFGIAALVAFATARPFSWRWFGGLAAAVLSFLSLSSGVATIVAAGVLVSLQLATNARKRCAREFAAVAVMAAIAVAMILSEVSVANPTTSPWMFVLGLVFFTSRIILAVVPAIWFGQHTLASRPPVSDRAWVAVGIAGWVGIQLVLLAYGRGILVAPRYMDMLLLAYPVGLVAVFAMADKVRVTRFRRYAGPGAVTWVLVVVAATAVMGYWGSLGAIAWSKSARNQEASVSAYLATKNVDYLKVNGRQGLEAQLYFPDPQELAAILEDPDVRAILPHEFRPADADNAEARNRMWLKGMLAGVTATTVRFLGAIGPVLLALGVGLIFAAGAVSGRPSARR